MVIMPLMLLLYGGMINMLLHTLWTLVA